MIDVSANGEWLASTLRSQQLLQMIIQGCWIDDSVFLTLYDFDLITLDRLLIAWETHFPDYNPDTIPTIRAAYLSNKELFSQMLTSICDHNCAKSITKVLDNIPNMKLTISVQDMADGSVQVLDKKSSKELRLRMRADGEYSFIVNVHRACRRKSVSVQTRHFTKNKDEMWFLILGYAATNTLVALKRVNVYGSGKYKVSYVSPSKPG